MATILVVDNKAINRQFLTLLLKYQHHRLIEASNGLEALSLVKENFPDLIITDISMPEMDGFQLAKTLQQDSNFATIPVIFYTATYRMEDAAVLAIQSGVKYLLPKPSEPKEILETIYKALSEVKFASTAKTSASMNQAIKTSQITLTKRYIIDPVNQIHNSLTLLSQKILEGCHDLTEVSDNIENNLNQLIFTTNRLVTMLEFNLDIFSTQTVHDLLRMFCKGSRRMIDARYGILGILSNSHNQLSHYLISGNNIIVEERTNDNMLEHTLIQNVLKNNEVINIQNMEDYPEIKLPPHYSPISNLLAAPICRENKTFGFLCYADKLGTEKFNDVDTDILRLLSLELSILYHNAKQLVA